jgi:hypothetical protein
MSDDLVERLRLPWPKDGSGDEVTLPLWVLILTAEAADRIEAMTKERDEAMQLLQTLSNMNGDLSRDMYKTKLLLAKAVEALRAVKQHQDSFFFGPDAQKNERASWRGVMREVKAALAEIESSPPYGLEGEKT